MAAMMPKTALAPEERIAGGRPRPRFRTLRARLRVIEPLAAFRTSQIAGERPVFIGNGGVKITRMSDLVRFQARQTKISEATLWRWLSRFEKFGFDGLAKRDRCDKGVSKRLRGLALVFVWAKAVGGVGAGAIHRELSQVWPRLQRDGSLPPSRATVRRFIRSLALAAPRRKDRPEKVQP